MKTYTDRYPTRRIKQLRAKALRSLFANDLKELAERCQPMPGLPNACHDSPTSPAPYQRHYGRLYSLLAVLTAAQRHHLRVNDRCLSRELSCQVSRVFSNVRWDASHMLPLVANPMTREERLAFRDRRRASVDAWLAEDCPGLDKAIVEANALYNTYRSQALRESATKDSQ